MNIAIFQPIIFLGAILLFIYFQSKSSNKNYAVSAAVLAELNALHLQNVKCETFSSGMKGRGYYFSRCELFITKDALVIFGKQKMFWINKFTDPLVFTTRAQEYFFKLPGAKLIQPKNLNLNSFGGDIYIEFVVPGLINTNVEFRLIGISDEVKAQLEFLNTLKNLRPG
ncbi:MAG: hypothetical protein V4594_01880 [Bacteroidota bacterium]